MVKIRSMEEDKTKFSKEVSIIHLQQSENRITPSQVPHQTLHDLFLFSPLESWESLAVMEEKHWPYPRSGRVLILLLLWSGPNI